MKIVLSQQLTVVYHPSENKYISLSVEYIIKFAEFVYHDCERNTTLG